MGPVVEVGLTGPHQHGAARVLAVWRAAQLVRNCKDAFLELLRSGSIDLLFANEEEAATLAVEMQLAPADGACLLMMVGAWERGVVRCPMPPTLPCTSTPWCCRSGARGQGRRRPGVFAPAHPGLHRQHGRQGLHGQEPGWAERRQRRAQRQGGGHHWRGRLLHSWLPLRLLAGERTAAQRPLRGRGEFALGPVALLCETLACCRGATWPPARRWGALLAARRCRARAPSCQRTRGPRSRPPWQASWPHPRRTDARRSVPPSCTISHALDTVL